MSKFAWDAEEMANFYQDSGTMAQIKATEVTVNSFMSHSFSVLSH